jgi:flagellar basal body rod protein FlgG
MFNQYTFQTIGNVNRLMQQMSENVADINNIFTTGYKAKQTTFHETLDGIKSYERKNLDDGVAKKTNRELDFALEGKGYFEIQLPDGTTAYTRDGSFTIGADGQLLSSQGYPVVTASPKSESIGQAYDVMADGTIKSFDIGANSSSIVIPVGSTVSLDEDGSLMTQDGDLLGKLHVVTFTNIEGLKDIGDNLFVSTEKTGEVHDVEIGSFMGQTQVKQGYLETSNVSIVHDMSKIVQLNSAIKAEMKIIKVLDQMQESLNSTITRNI